MENWEEKLREELFNRVIFNDEAIDWMIDWVKERDKEWLSCLPENDDGEHWHSIETWNNIFISEAKAKKLI